ncbi:sulfotransferase domain-containing protein [Candidatus Pelagibacter sp.]|nr:sulfotransferase domain-containing protein [Candidatus Pelagibacter sp.]
MIIWLASYPKSGNTFLRSLLTSYLFTDDGKFDVKVLNKINQFPDISVFNKLGIDTSNELEIVKNYINVQQHINYKDQKSLRFLKTHSSLNDINGYRFTDLNNTLGAIYVVRDPRSVVQSYSNHNQMSLEASTNRLFEHGATIGGIKKSNVDANKIVSHMGSWSANYNSWKELKKVNKYLLIKYEDLVLDTEKTFLIILEFIFNLGKSKLEVNKTKLKNTIKSTTFDSMQKLEKEVGFPESVQDKNGKKVTFFKYGLKQNNKNTLPKKLREKIELELKKEMQEIGYI